MSLHEQIQQYYPQYSDIQRYPADQCACIRKTKEEWGILGNFYHAPIVVEGVTIDCAERLFHLMKFRATADAKEGIKSEYAVKAGMNIKMHMKPIYRQHPEWIRDDWGVNLVGNEYVGPSLLGRLLMELRDTGKLDYTLPADAFMFLNFLK